MGYESLSAFGSAAFASDAFASNAFRPTIETTIGGGGSGSIRKRSYYPIIEPVEDFEKQKIELIRRQDAEIEEMIIMLITKGFI